jgi:hypothetical protein
VHDLQEGAFEEGVAARRDEDPVQAPDPGTTPPTELIEAIGDVVDRGETESDGRIDGGLESHVADPQRREIDDRADGMGDGEPVDRDDVTARQDERRVEPGVEEERTAPRPSHRELQHVPAEPIEAVQLRSGLVTDHRAGSEREQTGTQIAPPRRRHAGKPVHLGPDPIDQTSNREMVQLIVGHAQLVDLTCAERAVLIPGTGRQSEMGFDRARRGFHTFTADTQRREPEIPSSTSRSPDPCRGERDMDGGGVR